MTEYLIAIMVSLFFTIAWVFTLVQQAKSKRYVWLAITALIPVNLIIYWIVRLINK